MTDLKLQEFPRKWESFVMEIKVLQLRKRFLFCTRNLQLLANNDELFAKWIITNTRDIIPMMGLNRERRSPPRDRFILKYLWNDSLKQTWNRHSCDLARFIALERLDQLVRHRKQKKRIVQLARLSGDDPERNESRWETTTFWIVRAREREFLLIRNFSLRSDGRSSRRIVRSIGDASFAGLARIHPAS